MTVPLDFIVLMKVSERVARAVVLPAIFLASCSLITDPEEDAICEPIDYSSGCAQIEGKVTDANGDPVYKVTIGARSIGDHCCTTVYVRTDRDGEYVFQLDWVDGEEFESRHQMAVLAQTPSLGLIDSVTTTVSFAEGGAVTTATVVDLELDVVF